MRKAYAIKMLANINGFNAILRDENFLHKVCKNDVDLFINIKDNKQSKM
ncbi:MAG: hypothetical protein MRQ13_05805 [Candidatus Midichloria sp.]|nr:hypothetical protein [Candidatus Midichloria sp.]